MVQEVFLSYRRSDTATFAIALKFTLEEYLPNVDVFVDTAAIYPGDKWPDRLHSELENASAFLAVVGSHWRFTQEGTDRFADGNDWVRKEVSYALSEFDGRIIPVNVQDDANGQVWSPEKMFASLPADVAALPNIQMIPLRSSSFIDDARNIAQAVAKILKIDLKSNIVEYPKPNVLKSKAPTITQAEFNGLQAEGSVLSGWGFSSIAINENGQASVGSELRKAFRFTNFKRAFSFMQAVALVAEARPHHPIWTNQWNIVDVRLRTFDAGQKVTWYDVEMANKMNDIASTIAAVKKIDWPAMR